MPDTKNIVRLLEALEPWLLQLVRFNPDEENMKAAREETAQMLVPLLEEMDEFNG